jgi:hypothetical protein
MNYAAQKVFDEHFLPAMREVESRLGSVPESLLA